MDIVFIMQAIFGAIALVWAGLYIWQAKKSGAGVPWEKIRPILSKALSEIKDIEMAKAKGYGAVENEAIEMVRKGINAAPFLSKAEKQMISDDLIRSIIGPRLKELYEASKK